MRSTNLFGTLAKALAARTESASGWSRTVRRIVDGLVEIEIVDRSMTLAAQIFTSVLPVLIAGSFLPYWDLAAQAINDQLGFDTNMLVSGVGTFTVTDPTFAAFGVVGLLMVVISGTSFAKALARIYAKIWNVPSIGVRHAWRWLVVLLLVAFSAVLIGAIRELTGLRYVGVPLAIAGELVIWMIVWTISPYLLTMGKLSGRVLWMTGALTASGLTVVRAAGRLVLPRITDTAYTRFGLLGRCSRRSAGCSCCPRWSSAPRRSPRRSHSTRPRSVAIFADRSPMIGDSRSRPAPPRSTDHHPGGADASARAVASACCRATAGRINSSTASRASSAPRTTHTTTSPVG